MVIDAEKLRLQMIQAGYTTKQLAKAADISVSALQKILSDKTFKPRPKTTTKILLALNCSLYDVAKFFYKGDAKNENCKDC